MAMTESEWNASFTKHARVQRQEEASLPLWEKLLIVENLKQTAASLQPVEHRYTLKKLRKKYGHTQHQIATTMQVSKSAVSQLESTTNPTVGSLQRYLDSMGLRLRLQVETASGDLVQLVLDGGQD